MSKFEDESNERIVAEIQEIMRKEKRGFIFAPMVQGDGNHKTMVAMGFHTKNKEIGDVEIAEFYATLLAIICNFRDALPEKAAEQLALGFPAFSVLAQRYAMSDVLEKKAKGDFYD